MKKRVLFGIALLFLLVPALQAFPPTPTEFYGKAFIDGSPVKEGVVVEAYDSNNVLCGRSIVRKEGTYGFLSCNGDDPITTKDEGATPGSLIVFFIDRKKAATNVPALWKESSKQEIDIFTGRIPESTKAVEMKVEKPAQQQHVKIAMYVFFIALAALFFILTFSYINRGKKQLMIVLMLLLIPVFAEAFPPIACEFYGNVTINHTSAPVGTGITAYDADGVLCGSFSVVNTGYYGLLSCNGDDLDTSGDEGAISGENITFRINSLPTRRFFNFTWYQGSINFVYIDVNYAPVLVMADALYARQDIFYTYDVNATDENNDTLYFYDNATFFNISETTGMISFMPNNTDVGFYKINITVRDEFGLEDSKIINFTIIDVNDRPYFLHALENHTLYGVDHMSYDINASDVDLADTLTYFTNSTLFNISPSTGLIEWDSSNVYVGNHTINVTVCDNSGQENNCTSETFNIEVIFRNSLPVLSFIGPQRAYVNLEFELNITAVDEDLEQTLTFFHNSTFFNITQIDNYTATISFTPGIDLLGNHEVIIGVNDGYDNDSELLEFAILPELYCGDGICSYFIGETCYYCPADCGVCPPGGESNETGETGGETVEGGEGVSVEGAQGSGGSGISAIGITTSERGEGGTGTAKRTKLREITCKEEWECGEWGPCINGLQNRTCVDLNNCELLKERYERRGVANVKIITDGRPETSRRCGVIPTCFDGIQNQGEDGIDCGGPCPPCGVRAIPRYARLPFMEQPTLQGCGDGVCSYEEGCICMRDCRVFPWRFFIIFSSVLLGLYVLARTYLYYAYKKEIIKKGMLLVKIRRLNLVLMIGFVIITIIALYIYLYSSCESVFRRLLAIPLLLILVAPVLLYMILAKFGYLESRKIRKLKEALRNHKMLMEQIGKIEQDLLFEKEARAAGKLYLMTQTNNSSIVAFLPLFTAVYHDIRILEKARLENNQNLAEIEVSLCQNILKLSRDSKFKDFLKSNTSAQEAYRELEDIYSHLAQKEKIKKRIDEMEKELNESSA
ncbi:hypothetical protein JXA85_00980 [Candidatus Woesearchaeota archaeon]|nr:hypothetical protein [Candidatus Woesearchaeota archaeon]